MSQELVDRIKNIAHELKDRLPIMPSDTYSDVVDLCENNECGVGLEILCTQIYEFSVEITEKQYAEICVISSMLGIDSSYYSILEDLIKK